jgi:hypothetical protein
MLAHPLHKIAIAEFKSDDIVEIEPGTSCVQVKRMKFVKWARP